MSSEIGYFLFTVYAFILGGLLISISVAAFALWWKS